MAEPLKNAYNNDFVKRLASQFKKEVSSINEKQFIKTVLDTNWKNKELKDRTEHIADVMISFLPFDYKKQTAILIKIAPHFSGFTATIFPTVISKIGLADREISLFALEELTKYSTSEFAIRPFLKEWPDTIEKMYEWSNSDNFHVRRLASEGCRPLLPWAMKLHQYVNDPSPILPILENLRNDSEDYVYRSVANNLNDISKNHPDLVLKICKKWINESKTTKWVVKHALRTLLKQGNKTAMQLFGFGSIQSIEIIKFEIANNTIEIGNSTLLNITITNTGATKKFRLEYGVSYLKKNGSHNEKVFQLKETEINKGEVLQFTKKIDFKDLTTRKHYKGKQFTTLKINGNNVQTTHFELI